MAQLSKEEQMNISIYVKKGAVAVRRIVRSLEDEVSDNVNHFLKSHDIAMGPVEEVNEAIAKLPIEEQRVFNNFVGMGAGLVMVEEAIESALEREVIVMRDDLKPVFN